MTTDDYKAPVSSSCKGSPTSTKSMARLGSDILARRKEMRHKGSTARRAPWGMKHQK